MKLFKLADIKHDEQTIKSLLDNAQHHKDFHMVQIGLVLLAISAIFTDNIPLLIASIIAGLLAYPVLALSSGQGLRDWRLSFYMLMLLIVACLLALIISVATTLLFNDTQVRDVYISFTNSHYLAAGIALVVGAIAAYGLKRPGFASVITGATIAISLVPSLVAMVIGLTSRDVSLTSLGSTLLMLNVVGILVASMLVSRMFNLRRGYSLELA